MLIKAQAILLSKVRFGDNAVILQTYTREEGSRAFYYRIPGKSSRKSRILLTPLCELEIIAYKGKGEIPFVREIRPTELRLNLISDISKSSVVMFLNEVVGKTLREYHKDEELFDMIGNTLNVLDRVEKSELIIHLKFLGEFSRFMGFYPNGQYSNDRPYFDLYEGLYSSASSISGASLEPEYSRLLSIILATPIEQCPGLILTARERKTLLGALLDYYKIHIDSLQEIKSREILETILS